MKKTAILLVCFGTTFPKARQDSIITTQKAFKKAFPESSIYLAFTSQIVISRIKKNEKVFFDSPAQALKKIEAKQFKNVYIQSLHLIPGTEYSRMLKSVLPYKKRFENLVVGDPLLTSLQDYKSVVNFLIKLDLPLKKHQAVLFMGHGTKHPAFTAYTTLDYMMEETNHYMATIDSYPDVNLEIKRLKKAQIQEVILRPFMFVAGRHVHDDMLSSNPQSWQNILKANHFKVKPKSQGLGQFDFIRQQFIAYLKRKIGEVQ